MTQFDVVQKAAHYNQHPSGIEVIHVIRGLDFDLGSAFKYVARREGKELGRSLRSAIWYLQRMREFPERTGTITQEENLSELLAAYAAAETHTYARRFYGCMEMLVRVMCSKDFSAEARIARMQGMIDLAIECVVNLIDDDLKTGASRV